MTVGLLHAKQQRDFVADLNEEARAAGTEVVEAGSFADGTGNGNHLLPALVLDPQHDLRIVAEEQFGPSLPPRSRMTTSPRQSRSSTPRGRVSARPTTGSSKQHSTGSMSAASW